MQRYDWGGQVSFPQRCQTPLSITVFSALRGEGTRTIPKKKEGIIFPLTKKIIIAIGVVENVVVGAGVEHGLRFFDVAEAVDFEFEANVFYH